MRSAAIDAVQHRGHLQDGLYRLVVTRAARQAPGPIDDRTAAPCIRRLGQRRALRTLEALGAEVVERTVDVLHCRACATAVEVRLDHGVAAGRQVPAAGDAHHRTVGEVQLGDRIVLYALVARR